MDSNNLVNNPNEENKLNQEPMEEEEIGEHDIVIDEDFVINLDIAPVSGSSDLFASSDDKDDEQKDDIQLETEQSGNITF